MSSEHYIVAKKAYKILDEFMNNNYSHHLEDVWISIRAVQNARIKLEQLTEHNKCLNK